VLDNLVTREGLLRTAGRGSFERGLEIFRLGKVGELQADGEELLATVAGTRHYRVRLKDDDGDLGYSCSCPVGADGLLCKHAVAVGLAWLARGQRVGAATPETSRRATLAELGTYLAGLSGEDLLELVIEHAASDDAFRERLLREAGRRRRRRAGA
jgi:uncharacterized Zn finger protein